MKNRCLKILALTALISPLMGCGGSNSSSVYRINEIKISESVPTLIECGRTAQYTADSEATWTSDDDLVGEITEDGLFTAYRSGTINLTATSVHDPDITDTINVVVQNNTLIATTITSRISSIKVGETLALSATIENDTTNSGIAWQVSNNALASIDDKGNLKALQQGVDGKVVVTAYSKINPNSYDDIEVTINPSSNGETSVGTIEEKNGYKLIFEDDFNSERLNKSNWEVMTGTGTKYGVSDGWGNDESQFYLEDNLKVHDGSLIITAKKEKGRNDTRGKTYTSGRIRSKNKVSYTYGRIEAKLALPFGYGLWPAFWMLPDDTSDKGYGSWPNSGEIDIMEARGREHYTVDGTIHFADKEGMHTWSNGTYLFPEDQDISGEHVYAVEWDEGALRWYVDDNMYYSCDATKDKWSCNKSYDAFPAPFNKDFHILFNMAVGGNYDNFRLPDAKDLPARMKVDYVKWYQK